MIADLVIRPARADERAQLEALQWRASLANPGDRPALLMHPDAIALPPEQIADGHVFVAERLGEVLGFAAVLPRRDGDAELDALFVDPTVWKHGVGRLLIDRCATVAKQRAARLLHVVGNPHAEGFYLACGFRATGTVTTRFGSGLALQREV
ncbi:MAG TPA: GNAT family N-acetyltransferase [Vicinamibacterales bacterium]|nr:GNAT family N-acetyltransferase [Vicinamibacterales bacterium]